MCIEGVHHMYEWLVNISFLPSSMHWCQFSYFQNVFVLQTTDYLFLNRPLSINQQSVWSIRHRLWKEISKSCMIKKYDYCMIAKVVTSSIHSSHTWFQAFHCSLELCLMDYDQTCPIASEITFKLEDFKMHPRSYIEYNLNFICCLGKNMMTKCR